MDSIPDRQTLYVRPLVDELIVTLENVLGHYYPDSPRLEKRDARIVRNCTDAMFYVVLKHLYRQARFRLSVDLSERFTQCCVYVLVCEGVEERDIRTFISDGVFEDILAQFEEAVSFLESGTGWDTWEIEINRFVFVIKRSEDYRIKAFHFFEMDRQPERMILEISDGSTLLAEYTRSRSRRHDESLWD